MDSSPPRYSLTFAQSSPNLFTGYRTTNTRNDSSSSDVANSSSPFQPPLRRGISDSTSAARHSGANQSRPQTEGSSGADIEGAGTRETWMDFLRGTGSGDHSGNNSSLPVPFDGFGSGVNSDRFDVDLADWTGTGTGNLSSNVYNPIPPTSLHGFNDFSPSAAPAFLGPSGLNSSLRSRAGPPSSPRTARFASIPSEGSAGPSIATRHLQADRDRDRKRRLTDTTPSGREGGGNFNTSFASASGSAFGQGTNMSGSTIIDLTSSPDTPRRSSVGRRGSGSGNVGPRRTSSSGISGSGPGMRVEVPPRNGSGRSNQNEDDERRPSDIVLPRWQPDSEVTKCFVCGNTFGFFYRKHHCRKCGRVVCANCSPHRITMPRQFIVQPPPVIDLTDDLDGSPNRTSVYANPALGGGAEVRVCNPCVPDPNFSPPPQDQPPAYQPSPLQNFLQHDPFWDATPESQNGHGGQQQSDPFPPTGGLQQPLLPVPRPPPQPGDIFRDRRISFNNPTTTADLWPPPGFNAPQGATFGPNAGIPTSRPPQGFMSPPVFNDHLVAPRTSSRSHRSHHSTGTVGASASATSPTQPLQSGYRYRSLLAPLPPDPPLSAPPLPVPPRGMRPPPPPPQRQPRRQIAEEDECPVCSMELPPKGPNGETADRERHVEDCIASHFVGSSSSSQPQPASTATTDARPAGSRPGLLGAPASALSGASSSSAPSAVSPFANQHATGRVRAGSSAAAATGGGDHQPRRRRATGNRMLVYTATEKDCVGEDGEAAECIICFEEFEPGVELGRLECLCKFHRTVVGHQRRGKLSDAPAS
ncbi:FYVE-domain-containing protein [Rhizodiscina lignyota]|uniref:FYVE-domain-containing protein n=1 Tax=Rhizodiscina lignyota TaxID=1504668 RepID=A0A9P4I273_9PEZI|nr:FYVE-domain-containing protein [Rhizodiscina lignyota]